MQRFTALTMGNGAGIIFIVNFLSVTTIERPSNHSFDVVHSLEDIYLFLHDMAMHENVTIETIGQARLHLILFTVEF